MRSRLWAEPGSKASDFSTIPVGGDRKLVSLWLTSEQLFLFDQLSAQGFDLELVCESTVSFPVCWHNSSLEA